MFLTPNFISQAQISFPSSKLRHPTFYLTSPLRMFDKQIKLNVSKMELLVATPQTLPTPSPKPSTSVHFCRSLDASPFYISDQSGLPSFSHTPHPIHKQILLDSPVWLSLLLFSGCKFGSLKVVLNLKQLNVVLVRVHNLFSNIISSKIQKALGLFFC